MPWPRALLVSAGPAMLGFALSYVHPWQGIAVLAIDVVLGIIDLGSTAEAPVPPQTA